MMPLSLYHNGNKMIGVTLKIDTEVHEESEDCPWEEVEISIDYTSIKCLYGTSENIIWSEVDSYSGVTTLSIDGIYTNLYSSYFDLDEAGDGSWSDGTDLWFTLLGTIKFRGVSSTDVGEWMNIKDVYLPSLGIDDGISVEWQPDTEMTTISFDAPVTVDQNQVIHAVFKIYDCMNVGALGARIVWDNSEFQYIEHVNGEFMKTYTSISAVSGDIYDYIDIIGVDSSIGDPSGSDISVVDITFRCLKKGYCVLYAGETPISPNPYIRLSDDTVGMATVPVIVEDKVILVV